MFLNHDLVDEAVLNRFDHAEAVIRKAGQEALAYFRQRDRLQVEIKADPQDVVSIADRNVEITIVEGIRVRFSDDGFLGEEQGISDGSNDYLWVIDPIDGTACFLNGMHPWCISMALMIDNQIAFGLVYDPNTDELFSAVAGRGCFLNGQSVNTLNVDSVKEGVMGVGTSHRVPAAACISFLDGLLNAGGMFVRNGSGALMLAYVAAGRLIGYFEPHINAWDCLAGLILVKEAGGWTNHFLEGNGLLEGNVILVSASGLETELQELAGV